MVDKAVKTSQFRLLFMVLGLNVSTGIGLVSKTSVMKQEIFCTENMETTAGVIALDTAILSRIT